MFRARNSNQILFFKNQLKNIKKGKDESIQSYFMRLTEIMNNLLDIGEAISYQEMVLISLGGLPRDWHVFNTIILNNNVIPNFDEILMRCTQGEIVMMEYASNGNGSDPTVFTAHAKKKNHGDPRNQNHGRVGPKGRKGRCYICNKFGHYAREFPNRRDSPKDDDNNNWSRNGRNNRF